MRSPDLTIGSPPQTLRWHLIRWRGVQVALHRWLLSDNDRALHDHSAGNISILLTGMYWEYFNHSWEPVRRKLRLPLVPYYRKGDTPHRVQLIHGSIWTLWIRFKPWRDWLFHCPKGPIPWQQYVAERSYAAPGSTSTVGNGCG